MLSNHIKVSFFVLINISEINNSLSHFVCTTQLMLFDSVRSRLDLECCVNEALWMN